MVCLNFSIPQVKKDFDELKEIFKSDKIAYALLATNNGYNLDLTPQGNPSPLFNTLMKKELINGNRIEAIKEKSRVYSPSYLKYSNDWLNKEEPSITDKVFKHLMYVPRPTSLTDKASNFFRDKSRKSVDKILDKGSYSVSTPKKFKDLARISSMLELSDNEFRENGIFLHKGDENIMRMNADLFEHLYDEDKLVHQINEETREYMKNTFKDVPVHNTVSNKVADELDKTKSNRWMVTTDSRYTEDLPFEEHQKIRKSIAKRNIDMLASVNEEFINSIGIPVVSGKNVAKKGEKIPKIIITFDDKALKEYNSHWYSKYLNSMNTYLTKDSSSIHKDFTLSPLTKKLKEEKDQLKKEKVNLESKGGRQAEVNKIDNKIGDISTRLKVLDKDSTLTDIYNEAEIQLNEVKSLLSQPQLSPTQVNSARKKLETWIQAGKFEGEHLFLDEEQVGSEIIRTKFWDIRRRAEEASEKLEEIGKNVLANTVGEEFGRKFKYEDVVTLTHKLGWGNMGLSLNRIGHALAQFVAKIVNEANDSAFREAKTNSRYLGDLYEKLGNFDTRNFFQKEVKSIKGIIRNVFTGRLVHKFSSKYFQESARNKSTWFRKNRQFTLNPELLFNTTGEAHDKHVQEIVNNLGELEAKKYIQQAKDLYEEYEKVLEAHIASEYGTGVTKESVKIPTFEEKQSILLSTIETGQPVWIKYNSKRSESKEGATWRRIDKAVISKNRTSLTDVEGSSDLKTFNISLSNRFLDVSLISPELIEQQESYLNEEQKADLANWIKANSPIERIHSIKNSNEKSIYDVSGKDTFLTIIPLKIDRLGNSTGFYDNNFDVIESNVNAYEFYQEAEKITNNAQKIFGKGDFTRTSLSFVERSLWSKLSQVGISNFLTREVYDSIVESFEGGTPENPKIDPVTGKPVKRLRQSTTAIDTKIRELTKNKVKAKELLTGEKLTKEDVDELEAESSDEVFNDMQFDGKSTNLFQSLNLLNAAAQSFRHASVIEDTVNLAMTYLPKSTVHTGDNIIDSKGNPVGQKYIDQLQETVEHHLDVMYYKTPKSDTSSTLFNLRTREQKEKAKEIQDKIKASTNPEEIEALKLELNNLGVKVTTNSLVRRLMDFLRLKTLGWNLGAGFVNLTFGTISNMYKAAEGRMYNMTDWVTAEKEIAVNNKKFNNVVENYNIIGDILYEFKQENRFEEKQNWFFKTIKAIKPYALQTAIEKKNQGTVMIAMMLHQKVTNDKGETKSLWEAIKDDGKLTDEWSVEGATGDIVIRKMVDKIKSTIQEIHADFNNPLLIEKTTQGRTLTMFRKWIFEAVHARFGYEKNDYLRGIVVKGRYRTMRELGKQYGFNPFELYKAYKNNELSDVDAANIRGNIAEMLTMIGVLVGGAVLKNGICGYGEGRKCKDANLYQLTLLNVYNRLQQDTTFYANPKAWADFIKSPMAMTNYVIDIYRLYNLSYTSLFGEDEQMINKKTGESKWVDFGYTQLPGMTQYAKARKYGDELLNLN